MFGPVWRAIKNNKDPFAPENDVPQIQGVDSSTKCLVTEAKGGGCSMDSMETKCHGAWFVEGTFHVSFCLTNPLKLISRFCCNWRREFQGIDSQMPLAKGTWNIDVEWVASSQMEKKAEMIRIHLNPIHIMLMQVALFLSDSCHSVGRLAHTADSSPQDGLQKCCQWASSGGLET